MVEIRIPRRSRVLSKRFSARVHALKGHRDARPEGAWRRPVSSGILRPQPARDPEKNRDMTEAGGSRDAPQQVFVGDVQGCFDEFEELLDRLDRRFGDEWSMHLAGDLINRGPKSLAVLQRVRQLQDDGRATFVLGNHEISLLRVAYGLRPLGEHDSFDDVLESSERNDWLSWLRGQPLVECGEVEGARFAMVHAAAAPDWSRDTLEVNAGRVAERLADSDDTARELLAKQVGGPDVEHDRDVLDRITRCRSVSPGAWSSDEPGEGRVAWHAPWTDQRHDYGIVYGHWARQRLHTAAQLRGLDTGCVHHGRGSDGFLTAWLPGLESSHSGRCFDVPDDRFWQIPARRRYYAG
jgi:bis(5'-nucleosyl)-tetraphosphatase (symmetrical)